MHIAGIAQLVEHLIRNEGVVGSSPITGTIIKKSANADFFFIPSTPTSHLYSLT